MMRPKEIFCLKYDWLMEKMEITESNGFKVSIPVHWLLWEPLLNFTANIIEVLHGIQLNSHEFCYWMVLSFDELFCNFIELCYCSIESNYSWHWIVIATPLNCATAPLNQTAAGIELSLLLHWIVLPLLNETVVNCSYWWYSYWIQLELHFVQCFKNSVSLERLQDYTE